MPTKSIRLPIVYYLDENGNVGRARIDRLPCRTIEPEKETSPLAGLEQAEIKNGKVRIIDQSSGKIISINLTKVDGS